MKVEKTIVCGIVDPRKGKLEALRREYNRVQQYVHGEEVELYSATEQAVDRYTDWNTVKSGKEYSWYLRNDTFTVEKARDTVKFDYWATIPVADVWGGVTVPVEPHEEIKEGYEIHDSKIVRKGHGFELHLSVSKEVELGERYSGVLGIDLGLRNPVVSVSLPSRETMFDGHQIRDTQSHYFWLRRQTNYGNNRRKWCEREYNKVNDRIHKLTTKLVRYAKENNLAIAVGDLEGVQDQDKGRKMNRKLHRFPHYTFREQLKYKAAWAGILCMEVSEAYTSQRCSRCGKMGRKYKGKFECPHCGYATDRDKNGAQNIGQRALGKSSRPLSSVGAPVAVPRAGSYDFSSVLQENERKATSAA